jgi:hypothetical protein
MSKIPHAALASALVVVVGAGLGIPAASAKPPEGKGGLDLEYLATMKGACSRLVLGGQDLSGACVPKIVNQVYRSGRTGFTFVAGEQTIVSFSGMGQDQTHDNPDQANQPIDKVTFTQPGSGPAAEPATGVCSYTNPYKGPSTVKCVAKTARGEFSATFVSDGAEPSMMKF